MEWCNEHEDLLKEWAEKARFYSWMHHKTSAQYNTFNNMLTIPMIIISIVNGSINFTLVGNQSKSNLIVLFIPLLVGSLNIMTATLSALTKFFKTAELVEKHEMFYRQFNILVRNISLELSLPPNQRKPPTESLQLNRYDFDRLVNEAPRIPTHVITDFNRRFPYKRNKPEISNFFNKIVIHGRNQLYKNKADEFIKIRSFYKWKAAKHMPALTILPTQNTHELDSIRIDSVTYSALYQHNKRLSNQSTYSSGIMYTPKVSNELESSDDIFTSECSVLCEGPDS